MNYTFKGKRIRLATQVLELPNALRVTLDVIEHPGASLIVPFLDSKTIIMIKQFRPVMSQYLYELPTGTIDANETPLACVKREIIEETGFSAKKVSFLGKIYPVPSYSTEIIHIFKGERLQKEEMKNEPDEIIEVIALKKNQVKRLFKKRKILDAKTICALTYCGWL